MKRSAPPLSIAWLLVLSQVACAHTGRLAEYDFTDRALAVVTVVPARPDVFTGDWLEGADDEGGSLLGSILRVGGEVVREVEAHQARGRLMEASEGLDLGGHVAARVLTGAARVLGARPILHEGSSEFVLDIRIDYYGIEADSWDSQAQFVLGAEMFLLETRTGTEVWRAEIDAEQAINRGTLIDSPTTNAILTARALSELSAEEMRTGFLSLGDFCADELVDHLRDAMRKVR